MTPFETGDDDTVDLTQEELEAGLKKAHDLNLEDPLPPREGIEKTGDSAGND